MKIKYKVEPKVKKLKNGCKYSVKTSIYNEMTDELKEIIKTHKAYGFWEFSAHDWGETEVEVKITKITYEEI